MRYIWIRLLLAGSILFSLTFPAAAKEAAYFLINENNQIAILDSASGTIYHTGVPLSAIPETDAELIRSGFPCYDSIDLARAMENFCS